VRVDMKKMTNQEKIKKMHEIAKKHGVLVDRWGNVKYSLNNGKQVRFHFKKTVVRLEIKYVNEGDNRWYHHSSATISKISLSRWEERMKHISEQETSR
jgi:hypothetical protein